MNIRIGLTRDAYLCLLAKVQLDSSLRHIFKSKGKDDEVGLSNFEDSGAQPMGDDVEIYCSTEDAGELLNIAVPHCPDAVYPIEKALRGLP
jgi:hypothetical protein